MEQFLRSLSPFCLPPGAYYVTYRHSKCMTNKDHCWNFNLWCQRAVQGML